METTTEMLRKHFTDLHGQLDGIEHGQTTWDAFAASLADLRTVVQQHESAGSLAVNALGELDVAEAAAGSKNVARARNALLSAEIALKLSDTTASPAEGDGGE